MSDFKKGTRWRCSVSFLGLVIFLLSFFMAQSALALNAGSGSKSCNFQGYRYLDDNSIQVWIDKSMPDAIPVLNQFKIFEGTDIATGRELPLAGITQGNGNSCSYPGLSNGGSVILQSYESFEPGNTYTVVINSTVKANNGMSLGQNSAHQDVVFTFSAPDVAGSPNNASGEYAASIVPIISYKPAMNAVNVVHEGTIWLALNVPVKDVETANLAKNNLVLKKNGMPVITDDTIDAEPKENAEIYSPIFSDDLTFFYFPMTGGGAAYSYNLDYNQTYTLDIPAIETINGKTIPAQTLTFQTATDVVPTLISGVLTAVPTGNNLTITWPASTEIADVSPAASGYNVWASENPYWDFTRLSSSPVPATSTSYVTSGLAPGKTYNFRVSGVNGSAEGGFSDFVQAVTPAVTADSQAPVWTDATLSATGIKSTSLTLTWTPATDSVLVTNYRIFQDESLLDTVSGATYSKHIIGLTPDTSYSFKVEAGDAQGNWSTDGPEANVSTKSSSGGSGSDEDTESPTWENGNLTGTKNGEEVTLTWDGAQDNVDVTGYRIYRGSELIEEVDGGITTFTYNAPTGTGQQTYSVQAGDEAGNWSTDGPTTTLGGKNLPLINEYGLYNYDPDSNTTLPSSIGSVKTASPWTLTNVPCVFEDNIAIGIKFATNVAVDTHFSDNQDEFKMLDTSNNSVDILIDRAGDGTNTDINRNYLFVIPQETLQSGSQYKITIGPNLTSNNGMSAGVRQEVTFTTAKGGSVSTDDEDILTEGPTITSGSADVDPAVGAIVGLGSDAVVVISADALQGNSDVEVKVEKVISPPEAPANAHSVSDVYEFTVGGKTTYSFAKNVELRLKFDTSAVGTDEVPSIFYCDSQNKWISMGGIVSGSTITARVDHFTKYTVFAVKKPLISLNDISGHWAQSNIEELVATGAVSGYPDGSFKPGNPITRAEFATILVKAFKLTDSNGKIFADTVRHWAKDYIAKAAASGIVNGYDADTFGPDYLITREQMAVMIVRAAKLSPSAGEAHFADNGSISDWAEEFISTAVKNGLMKGYPDNTFLPRGSATRAEAVTVIVNALK
ncbi:MAG: Cellulosome-anchoring protein precursor [Pelotomaculum sp. PtaB.Bin104]|nr:MAG: Cellulosome-anchoring protein precursor [Pelotomaculum sp. PtaB.Bin104]